MSKKFELTNETIMIDDNILYRIKALKEFGDVKKGSLGGFVEKEDCLSQEGNAWVFGNAKVFGDVQVFGNAKVFGDAQVFGDAWEDEGETKSEQEKTMRELAIDRLVEMIKTKSDAEIINMLQEI